MSLTRLLDNLPLIGDRRIVSRRLKAFVCRCPSCGALCPRHGDPRDTSIDISKAVAKGLRRWGTKVAA